MHTPCATSTQGLIRIGTRSRCLLALALQGLMSTTGFSQTQGLIARTSSQVNENTSVLQVFLDGTLRATNDKTAGTTSATGALGFAFRSTNWQFVAQLNVAAKQDTVKSEPGRSILLPGTGGLSSGIFEARTRILRATRKDGIAADIRDRLFARAYVSASSYNWLVQSSATDTSRIAATTNVSGYGLGLSYRVLDGVIGTAPESPTVQLVFDVGYAVRQFAGDVLLSKNTFGRELLVGSTKRRFGGPEIGATIQYNSIQGSIVYYQLGSSEEIAGLNRGQLAAGFSIRAPILTGEYRGGGHR